MDRIVCMCEEGEAHTHTKWKKKRSLCCVLCVLYTQLPMPSHSMNRIFYFIYSCLVCRYFSVFVPTVTIVVLDFIFRCFNHFNTVVNTITGVILSIRFCCCCCVDTTQCLNLYVCVCVWVWHNHESQKPFSIHRLPFVRSCQTYTFKLFNNFNTCKKHTQQSQYTKAIFVSCECIYSVPCQHPTTLKVNVSLFILLFCFLTLLHYS